MKKYGTALSRLSSACVAFGDSAREDTTAYLQSAGSVTTRSRMEPKVDVKLRLLLIPLFAAIIQIGCNVAKPAVAATGDSAHIIAAGSSFVYPIMMRWVEAYQGDHQGVRINYQSIGSGGGIQQLKGGMVDFGASDAALDHQNLKEMPALVQIAESAGPVCITYNLEQLKVPMNLSAKTLSGIYLGTIKNWQDPAIKKDNPGVNLPQQGIVVVHRSDGSGTTNIFTTYLADVSPDWNSKVSKGLSVSWPLGVRGEGTEGVTGLVKQSPGAIGYVELTYAEENKLPVAKVQNAAGRYLFGAARQAVRSR